MVNAIVSSGCLANSAAISKVIPFVAISEAAVPAKYPAFFGTVTPGIVNVASVPVTVVPCS